MDKRSDINNRIRSILTRTACTAAALLLVLMLAPVLPAHADPGTKTPRGGAPIREVHKVAVGNKAYCLFVTDNVVLTPAEISAMSDDELNAEVQKQSGLYLTETNCTDASHKAISAETWNKSHGKLFLSEQDIQSIRSASPADGAPVKLYLDMQIADKVSEDGEPETSYSTYKRLSPSLMFIAVASEADAGAGEDYCEAKPVKPETPPAAVDDGGGDAGEPAEILPEERTIKMADRSGPPVPDTLKDGDPVTLEWIEPGRNADSDSEKSFLDHIPGGAAGLVAAAAAAAAVVYVVRRKRKEKND